MARYAVVNADNQVVNVIELVDGADWTPPEGERLILSNDAGPGWTRTGRSFTPPAIEESDPSFQERYAGASTTTAKLAIVAERLGLTTNT